MTFPTPKSYGGIAGQEKDWTKSTFSTKKAVASIAKPKQEDYADLGNFSVNPSDPIGTAEGIQTQGQNVFEGLKNALFGTSQPDRSGQHGGFLGDVPGLGAIARAGSETIANAGGALLSVPGHAADLVGGALEHIEVPSDEDIDAAYNAIPEDDALRISAEEALQGDGSFIGPASAHIKAEAVTQYRERLSSEGDPSLFDNLFVPTVSVADAVTNLFGLLSAGERVVERGYAGFDSLREGQNQLDMIMGVGRGEQVFSASWQFGTDAEKKKFATELTPVEQHVFDMVDSGRWTNEQGLDYIASHGRGISHDQLSQIAGSVAFDPIGDAAIVMSAGAALGLKGVALAKGVTVAEEALTAAKLTGDAEKIAAAANALTDAQKVYATKLAFEGSSPARLNLMGKLMNTPEGTQIVKVLSRPYVQAQNTVVSRSFKVARQIVDPLHDFKLPGFKSGSEQVDLTTELVMRTGIDGIGRTEHLALFDELARLDPSGTLAGKASDDLGTHFANRTREIIATQHRNNNVAKMGAALKKMVPGPVVDELMKHGKTGLLQTIKEDANRWMIRVWSAEDNASLVTRLDRMYGELPEGSWADKVAKWDPATKSLMHAATYGSANESLFAGIAKAKDLVAKAAEAGTPLTGHINEPEMLDRLILMRRDRLTNVGLDGIVKRLDEHADDVTEQIMEMRRMQSLYPELNYISIDRTNLPRTIENFRSFLEKTKKRLPAQVLDEELALNPELKQLQDDMGGAFTLGFRPEQEYLWGIELTADGYVPVGSVFVDHVSASGPRYRVAQGMSFGPDGAPLAMRRPVDWVKANAAGMMNAVSGSMIAEAARQKFVGNVAAKWSAYSIDKNTSQKMWHALHDMLNKQSVVVNPRGFDANALYKNVFDIIPPEARHAGFNEHELMSSVLDAYVGDLRFVGATQWLSGRAKKALFEMTGSNFAGQIAEMAWPLLKFRVNAVFQAQERIEPWVLNGARGVDATLGVKMTREDMLADVVLKRHVEQSIVTMGDVDMAEQGARILQGDAIEGIAKTGGTVLNKMREAGASIANVQGAKRVNMLRTFRRGLGKEVRSAWEEARPGEFDKMKLAEEAKVGHLIKDDDYAIQMIAENLLSNDITVKRALTTAGKFTGMKAEFAAAVKTADMYTPAHVGQLRALEMDSLADMIQLGGSRDLKGLRAVLADGTATIDDLTRVMRQHGMQPDYIARVENALNFHWDDFMGRLSESFHLTPEQLTTFQEMIAGVAQTRGLTPVEYLSQVFAPNIMGGETAMMGSLGKGIKVMINGKEETVSHLARFAAGDKAGFDDLIRQYSEVFATHLDPSAKRALLLEFKPELRAQIAQGNITLDMADIDRMADHDFETWLSDRIIDYANGTPGTGAHTLVTDPKLGSARARNITGGYSIKSGRTGVPDHRPNFDLDEDLAKRLTKEWDDTPSLPLPTDTVPVTPAGLKAALGVKPLIRRPRGLSARVGESYQMWVEETRAQYLHMTLGAGGQKIKVQLVKKNPYQGATGAKQLANDIEHGKVKVWADDVAHPILTPEQVVEFRAVHTVYGRATEGFGIDAQGAINSVVTHAKHYDAEARAAMISDQLGVQLGNHYSTALAPGQSGINSLKELGEALWPGDPNVPLGSNTVRISAPTAADPDAFVTYRQPQRLGRGAQELDAEAEARLVSIVGPMLHQFPGVKLGALEVGDMATMIGPSHANDMAVTFNFDRENTIIFINEKYVKKGWQDHEAMLRETNEAGSADEFMSKVNPFKEGMTPRPAAYGLPSDDFTGWSEAIADDLIFGNAAGEANAKELLKGINEGVVAAEQRAQSAENIQRVIRGEPMDNTPIAPMTPEEVSTFIAPIIEAAFTPGEAGRTLRAAITDPYERALLGPIAEMISKNRGAIIERADSFRYRLTEVGSGFNAGTDLMSTLYHEFGHVVERDLFRDAAHGGGRFRLGQPAADELKGLMSRYVKSKARRASSEYSFHNHAEAWAELWAITFSPSGEAAAFAARRLAQFPELKAYSDELKEIMQRYGAYRPYEEAKSLMTGPRITVAEANARGKVKPGRAPKVGAATQDIQEDLDEMLEIAVNSKSEMTGPPGTVKRYEKMMGTEKSITYVLYDDTGKAAGFTMLSERPGKPPVIGAVETRKDVRRKGIATHLYQRAAADGFPIEEASTLSSTEDALTTLGKQFRNGRRAKAAKVAAQPGPIIVKSKGNMLSDTLLDEIREKYIGVGKYSEANPDIARTARYFGKFMTEAVQHTIEHGTGSEYAGIFDQFGMMPKLDATPYNYSEALLNDLAVNNMTSKWKDAYRLQYYARDRSMLQRSINHPMFGIYPASYMWGKILPEMVQFIAQRPFGTRTGGMLDQMLMAQRATSLMREYDPEFDKKIEEVGHNPALSFLAYMLPSLPWDVNSGIPVWARGLAKQGMVNQNRVERGDLVQPTDLAGPAEDTVKKLVPYTTSIPWAARAAETAFGDPTRKQTKAPTLGPSSDNGPVQGVDLGPTLADSMQELRDALSR